MAYEMSAGAVGNAIGSAIQNLGNYTARAAANANGVSFASQNQQGNFNAGQAALANDLGTNRIMDQYTFNSGQAAMANQFTSDMWDRAAAWNEAMWEKTAAWNEMMQQRQMDFNSAEALKQRKWQQKMAETSYQRAVTDMEKAGINPILASGGISVGAGSGSSASIGGSSIGTPSMTSAMGQMASGGLINGISASEGNFQGQMEYMAGTLGLLSAAIGSIGSAMSAFGSLGDIGKELGESFGKILEGGKESRDNDINSPVNRYGRKLQKQTNQFINPTYKQ